MKNKAELLTPKKILIIKPSSLGDVVSATPLLRGLRRKFPDAHIAWLLSTACSDLLADDPDIDEIIPFERKKLGKAWFSPGALVALMKFFRRLKKAKFDWVIDLQGLLRSAWFTRATKAPLRVGFRHTREKWAKLFYNRKVDPEKQHTVDRNMAVAESLGIPVTDDDLKLCVSDKARAYAETMMAKHKLTAGEFVVCVPPTRWTTKFYPPRQWRKVVADIASRRPVVLVGAPGDHELCQSICEEVPGTINIAGETNVGEMVGIIAASGVVLCSDSAASLTAPAVGVPVVVIIGPTRPELTGPYRNGVAIVADIPCQGCLKRSCSHITCMELIDPAAIVEAAERMLSARSA